MECGDHYERLYVIGDAENKEGPAMPSCSTFDDESGSSVDRNAHQSYIHTEKAPDLSALNPYFQEKHPHHMQ